MTCRETQELFGLYWDLPDGDVNKVLVDEHLKSCENCSADFRVWEQSMYLIRTASHEKEEIVQELSISDKVMSRIYHEESWRIPIQNRIYVISDKWRARLTWTIAICLTIFLYSFVYSIFEKSTFETDASIFDVRAPQEHQATSSSKSILGDDMGTAVASLNTGFIEPLQFPVGPLESGSQNLLVLSFLGLVYCFLILSWVLRIRS
jgi:hypothetical protein